MKPEIPSIDDLLNQKSFSRFKTNFDMLTNEQKLVVGILDTCRLVPLLTRREGEGGDQSGQQPGGGAGIPILWRNDCLGGMHRCIPVRGPEVLVPNDREA